MRPLESRVAETRQWLRLAARDLRMAELGLGDQIPLVSEALFHAQQAAEKALKGFLVWNGLKYPLTHDIRLLLEMCTPPAPGWQEELAEAAGLTQFAVRFRYPTEEEPTAQEARHWLELARAVFRRVQLAVPAEARA